MASVKVFTILYTFVVVVNACDQNQAKLCMGPLIGKMGMLNMTETMQQAMMSAMFSQSNTGSVMDVIIKTYVDSICSQEDLINSTFQCLTDYISGCDQYASDMFYFNTDILLSAYQKICAKNAGNNEYVFFSPTALQCMQTNVEPIKTCAMNTVQKIISDGPTSSREWQCSVIDQFASCSQHFSVCGLDQKINELITEFKPDCTSAGGCSLSQCIVPLSLKLGSKLMADANAMTAMMGSALGMGGGMLGTVTKSVGLICSEEAAVKSALKCLTDTISGPGCKSYAPYINKMIKIDGAIEAFQIICSKNDDDTFVFFGPKATECISGKMEECPDTNFTTLIGAQSQEQICTMYMQAADCAKKFKKCKLDDDMNNIIFKLNPTCAGIKYMPSMSSNTIFMSCWVMLGAILFNLILD